MNKILVVEDEPDILEMVRYNLVQAGLDVETAEDAESALQYIRDVLPDLIVLDLMLPGIDGLDMCRQLKQDARTRPVPILMLTARKEEVDRIVGLELGADDYVVKPFSPRELVLRVRAILKRSQSNGHLPPHAEISLRSGPLSIDKGAHQALLNGAPLELTGTEFRLLLTLIERKGRVQTRDELLDTVWGYEYSGYGRTVDTHIRRLREKLGDASNWIETVRGIGYRFRRERA